MSRCRDVNSDRFLAILLCVKEVLTLSARMRLQGTLLYILWTGVSDFVPSL
jgi:hypothetical protein